MTTEKAFEHLLNNPTLLKKIEMSDTNRRQFLHKLKNAPATISFDAMRKWLEKAGYVGKVDWKAPGRKKPTVETAG